MTKRHLAALSCAAALAAVAAPAFADYSIGYDPDYVPNPYGQVVARSAEGTPASSYAAGGFDPWYVPGQYARPYVADRPVDPREQYAHAPHVEPGHAYAEPWLGEQADA